MRNLAALILLPFWIPSIPSALLAAEPEATPESCEVCATRFANFNGTAYVMKDPVRRVSRHLCKPCVDSEEECWACGLPVHDKTLLRLGDGRILCQWDKEGIVTDEKAAQILFQQHVREWQNRLSPWPPFPTGNLHLHLVDQNDFRTEYRRRPQLHPPEAARGLMTRVQDQDGKTEYHIYVLSGLLRNQFLAVCAHEYAHTWMAEHDNKQRVLHSDCEEGFCEWLAMNYMVQLGDEVEQERIRRNDYTSGQIDAFIAAESKYRFYDVMQWVLHGIDTWLDEEDLGTVIRLRKNSAPAGRPPVLPRTSPAPVLTPVPAELTLKGISGTGRNGFVIINNQTLAEGEEGDVRVGEETVRVKCLRIERDAAWIQVDEDPQPRRLRRLGQ